jgi:hypothetical protein
MAAIVTSRVPSREVNDRDPLLSDDTVHGEHNTRRQADIHDDTDHRGEKQRRRGGN